MEKDNTKYEVSKEKLEQLNRLKNKLLLWNGNPLFVTDFIATSEKIKGNWFRPDREVCWISELSLFGFHPEKKYWGTVDGYMAVFYVSSYDLDEHRNKWLTLRQSLTSFGISLTWQKDGTEVK